MTNQGDQCRDTNLGEYAESPVHESINLSIFPPGLLHPGVYS